MWLFVHHRPLVLAIALWVAGSSMLAHGVSLDEVRHELNPAVEALPVLGRFGLANQTRLVVRGQVSTAQARRLLKLIRVERADLFRRFGHGGDHSGTRPIQVCLFSGTAAYRVFVRSVFGPDTFEDDLGFFAPYQRLVGVDLRRGTAALRHELVHALLFDAPGRLPYWAEEGLASLYAGGKAGSKGSFTFQKDHRLDGLLNAKAANRLPGFDRLTASDDRQVYGLRWRSYYALGRFVMLYLPRRGKLTTFVAAARKAPKNPAVQLALLQAFVKPKPFWKWVDGLGESR